MLLSCGVLSAASADAQIIKRNRNEGTISVPASNVIGASNITPFAYTSFGYGNAGLSFVPIIGADIGVADILQVTGQMAIPKKISTLGSSEVHVILTTPFNDNLRFFGLAISADLYLSSIRDTISKASSSEKPLFSPHLAATLLADIDCIALWKTFPVKAYLSVGMVDNSDLLFQYEQLTAKAGLELKLRDHGLFANIGFAAYKEKSHKYWNGDESFSQFYAWAEPGGRYRLFNRFSILAGARIRFFMLERSVQPFTPEVLRVSIKFELPLFLRETNAEAIRSLIFMEQVKQKRGAPVNAGAVDRSMLGDIGSSLENIDRDTTTFDYSLEKANLKKQRETIQKKMESIENLLDTGEDFEASPADTSGVGSVLQGTEK